MTNQRITPENVTKPIQLLAAWLVGLILVNALFLLSAQHITNPCWASSLLVTAAVVNVPLFIGALFLLQTKFRPQMQEDSYYSVYLQQERTLSSMMSASTPEREGENATRIAEKIIERLGLQTAGNRDEIIDILHETQQELLLHKHGTTRTLSELFLARDTWNLLVERYFDDTSFVHDIESLVADGLAKKTSDNYKTVTLTTLGSEIAKKAQDNDMLFSQQNEKLWRSMRRDMNTFQT